MPVLTFFCTSHAFWCEKIKKIKHDVSLMKRNAKKKKLL